MQPLPVDVRARPTRSGASSILTSADLPTADLTDSMLEHFFYVGSPEIPIALVGLEFLGDYGLLRSLVVAPSARTGGMGSTLMAHAEAHAKSRGVRELFLLTTTADRFFERRGYVRVARDKVPPPIRSTREFADICPASSTIMVKAL